MDTFGDTDAIARAIDIVGRERMPVVLMHL